MVLFDYSIPLEVTLINKHREKAEQV